MSASLLMHPNAASGAAILALTTLLLVRRWRARDPDAARGTRILTRIPNALRGDDTRLAIAGVALTPLDELKHFKLIGTTGTGKSTAIRQLLAPALARGDRLIIADPDDGYRRRFYSPLHGDVVLNPYDPDSVSWDLFGEIEAAYDVEQIASALIPNSEDPASREWRGYGRTLLAAVMRHCKLQGFPTRELWRLLMRASHEEIRAVVQGTSAAPFLEPDNARMFTSIRSVVGSALGALEHLQAQRTRPLSIRRWVRDAGAGRALFIPYRANQIAALRGLIAAWLRLAIFEVMSLPEGQDQRLWLVIDELDALGAIDGLKDALARLRKFGCRCVLGFQSVAQVSGTYGAADAQTIVENCGNSLILRCSSSENGGTAAFASKLVGERQLVRKQRSRGSEGAWLGGSRRSRSVTEQVVTEAALLPSEIEQLPDLCGYFKAASSASWITVQLGDSHAFRS